MDLQTSISKKIAYLGIYISLALIFSYVESLIPFDFKIPGIKLGIANSVVLILLYVVGFKEAILVSVARVVLSSLLFGNIYSFIFSIAGAMLSVVVMGVLNKKNSFSIIGISMMGGIFHNIGQLIVASIIVHQLDMLYYGCILILSGLITGCLIGILGNLIFKRVETYVRL